ncbi:MAG: FAD-dependent oxidoreductase [Caulobacteraceae bacterium]|nr:FAD-dependent oxidoreductase [Caulobacteraceae bacterium]
MIEPLARPDQSVVIVGAGLAGLRAAEAVREAGFPGRVVLVGEEAHEPYDRPPLSKAVLQEEGHERGIALSPEGALAGLGVELRLGRRAVAIDRKAREVELADGERIAYDRLVLATGSRVRALDILPPGAAGVHYLRGLDDALALRAALKTGGRLAVVGGGVIGMEVAASARALGCECVVIEAGPRLMARAAAPAVSTFLHKRHLAEGVDVRLGVTVAAAEPSASPGAWRLRLSSGETIEAQAVVVGVGVSPNIDLARDCGLEVRPEGVVVDGFGATSDPAVYAAGEVALHLNDLYGRHDRQETWAHAAAHGQHVGEALVSPTQAYRQPPSYWSDQYDINLQVTGLATGDTDVVRGDPALGRFLVFHLAGGRIEGVSAVNAVRELRTAKRLIGACPADLEALADPARELKIEA